MDTITITNNKTAVLLYGEYRQFDIAIKSWDFLLEYDFYCSLWDTSHQYNKKLNIDYFQNINKDSIINFHKNSNVVLHNENIFSNKSELINKSRNFKSLFHWKSCIDLLYKSNIKYDKIILMRPDIHLSLLKDFKHIDFENKIFTANNFNSCELTSDLFVHDAIIMGSFESINYLINSFENDESLNHNSIALKILNSKFKNHNINEYINFQIIRPNVRNHPEQTPAVIDYCYREWANTHCEEDILFLDKKYNGN